jgi:RHS repeat-associated core domain
LQRQKRRHDRAGRVLETGRFRYRYDACGRVIEKTENKAGYRPQVTRFSWNADDRLTHIELPNGTRYRYRYDPFGRRIAKECEHSDTQTHYLWDGAHIVQQQQATADGQVLQQTESLYEPGSFRPMAQVTHHEQGSEPHYIVTDHAGTPQELCNEQGDIVWRGEQALWGHYHGQSQRHWQRREEAANDSIQCGLRYQGQIEDSESGLYYNVNRYYDADSGQYLSPDPIGFAGGLRPQAYVANPLEWVDPLGLAGCEPKNNGSSVSNKSAIPQNAVETDKYGNIISRQPKSIQDQMALDAAKRGEGIVKIDSLSDPKYAGMQKMELEIISAGGKKSNVHYVRDPVTGNTMDFKFKKHSSDYIHGYEKVREAGLR